MGWLRKSLDLFVLPDSFLLFFGGVVSIEEAELVGFSAFIACGTPKSYSGSRIQATAWARMSCCCLDSGKRVARLEEVLGGVLGGVVVGVVLFPGGRCGRGCCWRCRERVDRLLNFVYIFFDTFFFPPQFILFIVQFF